MSTRATYQFVHDDGFDITTTTLYVHHDGYPEGAARKYQQALDTRPHSDLALLAEQFIRANADAEIVNSHESQGGTEYRYTVFTVAPETEAAIVAEHHSIGPDSWATEFEGPLGQFIAKYS